MKKMIVIAAAAACLLSAAPAFAASACLRVSDINGWTPGFDNKTVVITDDFHHKFKLTLMGYCPNLKFKERLGIKTFGGTRLSCVSKGDDIISRDVGTGASRCPITDIVPYTPDMEKADADAAAAKKAAEQSH